MGSIDYCDYQKIIINTRGLKKDYSFIQLGNFKNTNYIINAKTPEILSQYSELTNLDEHSFILSRENGILKLLLTAINSKTHKDRSSAIIRYSFYLECYIRDRRTIRLVKKLLMNHLNDIVIHLNNSMNIHTSNIGECFDNVFNNGPTQIDIILSGEKADLPLTNRVIDSLAQNIAVSESIDVNKTSKPGYIYGIKNSEACKDFIADILNLTEESFKGDSVAIFSKYMNEEDFVKTKLEKKSLYLLLNNNSNKKPIE